MNKISDLSSYFWLPTMMELPTSEAINRGVVVSFFFVPVLLLLYFTSIGLNSPQGFNLNIHFGLIMAVMLIHLVISFQSFCGNYLIFFRYLMLFVPTFITVLAWFLWNGEVLIGPFGYSYQTLHSTSLLVTAGSLSLLGCTAGWLISFSKKQQAIKGDWRVETIMKENPFLIRIGTILTILFGVLYVISSGGLVSGSRAYGEGSSGLDITFGVFNVIQLTGISMLVITSALASKVNRKTYWVITGSLLLCVLAGSRADYLPPLIFITLYFLARSKYFSLKSNQRNLIIILVLLVIVMFIFASAVAQWRADASKGILSEIIDIILNIDKLFIVEFNGQKLLYIETGNQMIGGMYGVIENTKKGGFLMGSSYLDYLLRLPPAFLNLPRPNGIEWSTGIGEEIMSQGGIFEPAESYANFGLFGCFPISFLISYFFGFLLRRSINLKNLFYLCFYLVFGLMGFRAVWYQNFSYCRIISVFLCYYYILSFTRPSIINRNYRKLTSGD
jgi:hypothetical protein